MRDGGLLGAATALGQGADAIVRAFPDAETHARWNAGTGRRCLTMATATIDAPSLRATRFEYLVVPLKEAKNVKKEEDAFVPEHLNELGAEGWEAVGLSLKYGDLMAWPVVLLKRPIR